MHGRVEGAQDRCAVPGCAQPGEYKAPLEPANFNGPGSWRFLCLDHVREHNSAYNFFHGMSPDGSNAFKGDPKLDDMISKIGSEFDQKSQVAMSHDLIRYMTGQTYMVPRPVANRAYQLFWPAIGNLGLNERWAGNNAVWTEEYQNWWIDTTKAPFV